MFKSKIENFLIGTDFEMFGKDINGIRSLVPFIEGTKTNPLSIGNGCHQQLDNILYEANTPPVNNRKDFLDYIKYCIDSGNKLLKDFALKLYASSSEVIDPLQLNSKSARTFGCEPSQCAYEDDFEVNRNTSLRTAGFHIHIGFKSGVDTLDEIKRLMVIMDSNISLPGIFIDPDRVRRRMYGRAGEFRVADRGEYTVVEYRAIGSFFLRNPQLIGWVYDQTIQSIKDFNAGVDFTPDERLMIQQAINNYDTKLVQDTFNITFVNGQPKINQNV